MHPSGKAELNKEVHCQMLVDKMLLAIMAEFPTCHMLRCGVMIQEDGIGARAKNNDKEFKLAMEATKCKIGVCVQAAQFPNLNINH